MGHNEPVEHAQKTTGAVTAAALLATIRQGNDSIGLHGSAAHGRASYSDSFVFEVAAHKRDRKTKAETRATIQVPGYVSNGHTSTREDRTSTYDGHRYTRYSESFRPTSGFWYLFSSEALVDVLEILPRDAEVSFHVYLDAGTNDLHVNADVTLPYKGSTYTEKGLHGDHLYLEASYMVRGKRKTRRYLISTTCGAHNSARFGVRG